MITSNLNPKKVEWLTRVWSAWKEVQLTPSRNNSINPERNFMTGNVEDFRHTAFWIKIE